MFLYTVSKAKPKVFADTVSGCNKIYVHLMCLNYGFNYILTSRLLHNLHEIKCSVRLWCVAHSAERLFKEPTLCIVCNLVHKRQCQCQHQRQLGDLCVSGGRGENQVKSNQAGVNECALSMSQAVKPVSKV